MFAQSCLYGVILRVATTMAEVSIVTNPMIVGLRLPERVTYAVQQSIRFVGGIGFPTVQDRFERVSPNGPHHGVDVVGHYHPRVERMARAFKTAKCSSYKRSDFRAAKPRVARRLVKQGVNLGSMPCKQLARMIDGITGASGHAAQQIFALFLEASNGLTREGVGQPKCDEIRCSIDLDVGQVAAGMKAGQHFGAGHQPVKRHPNRQGCPKAAPPFC